VSDSERIAALDELFLEVGKYHYTRITKNCWTLLNGFLASRHSMQCSCTFSGQEVPSLQRQTIGIQ
jgi:hypothetical protein